MELFQYINDIAPFVIVVFQLLCRYNVPVVASQKDKGGEPSLPPPTTKTRKRTVVGAPYSEYVRKTDKGAYRCEVCNEDLSSKTVSRHVAKPNHLGRVQAQLASDCSGVSSNALIDHGDHQSPGLGVLPSLKSIATSGTEAVTQLPTVPAADLRDAGSVDPQDGNNLIYITLSATSPQENPLSNEPTWFLHLDSDLLDSAADFPWLPIHPSGKARLDSHSRFRYGQYG